VISIPVPPLAVTVTGRTTSVRLRSWRTRRCDALVAVSPVPVLFRTVLFVMTSDASWVAVAPFALLWMRQLSYWVVTISPSARSSKSMRPAPARLPERRRAVRMANKIATRLKLSHMPDTSANRVPHAADSVCEDARPVLRGLAFGTHDAAILSAGAYKEF